MRNNVLILPTTIDNLCPESTDKKFDQQNACLSTTNNILWHNQDQRNLQYIKRINGDDEPIEDEEIKSHSDISNKRSKNKDSDTIVDPNTNPQDFAKNIDTSGSYK